MAAAGIILIPGAPLLSIALNANVLATVLLPGTLMFVILLASDRQLMGRRANTTWLNVVAAAIVTVVAGCGAAYGIDSFLQASSTPSSPSSAAERSWSPMVMAAGRGSWAG